MKLYFAIQLKNVHHQNVPINPWFSDETGSAKVERRAYKIDWRKNKTAENKTNNDKAKMNVLQTADKCKGRHNDEKIIECGRDPSVLYELMKKEKQGILPESERKDTSVDKFNCYFVDKIRILGRI